MALLPNLQSNNVKTSKKVQKNEKMVTKEIKYLKIKNFNFKTLTI